MKNFTENMIDSTRLLVENFDGFPEFDGITYVSYNEEGNASIEAEADSENQGYDSLFYSVGKLFLKFSQSRTIEDTIEDYISLHQ
jgi:hypothetical protein